MYSAPHFWTQKPGWQSGLLTPLGWIYNFASQLRHRFAHPFKAPIPVICVGNLTLGGTGKTPTVLYVTQQLKTMGHNPHIISRGYGGSFKKSCIQVDPIHHKTHHVGDEPILLAHMAPTWVCANRITGVQRAITAGADCIILDDGFQNPLVRKDLSILVVDGPIGYGNGCVFPAGPLREKVKDGLKRAHLIVIIGENATNVFTDSVPVCSGTLNPISKILIQPVVAFAGIGRPEKFFQTLKDQGISILATRSFPDHHPYTSQDISDLQTLSKIHQAPLITTAKDRVRLPTDFALSVQVLDVALSLKPSEILDQKLKDLFHAR